MTIPGVCQKKGKTYRRFRYYDDSGKRKDVYVSLPDPTDPRFATELARVNNEAANVAKRGELLAGSFGALAREFRAAINNGWSKRKTKKKGSGASVLAPATLENYKRYIAMFEDGTLIFKSRRTGLSKPVRDMMVTGMRPSHVYQLRDSMADHPGKANNWLNVLKVMMGYACERDWRADNPASDVSPLPIGEHEPWPRDVLIAAMESGGPTTRLAIVTLLCSGQRVSDVIRIQHNWLKTGIMELSQVKTGVQVAVPVHPWWREEIAKIERRSTTVLYDRSGKPFSDGEALQERMRDLMKRLGFVDETGKALYTCHGLRKNACCYLLETGMSDTDVGAILGMTPETVRHYGKRARAYMIAVKAAEKVASILQSSMAR